MKLEKRGKGVSEWESEREEAVKYNNKMKRISNTFKFIVLRWTTLTKVGVKFESCWVVVAPTLDDDDDEWFESVGKRAEREKNLWARRREEKE